MSRPHSSMQQVDMKAMCGALEVLTNLALETKARYTPCGTATATARRGH